VKAAAKAESIGIIGVCSPQFDAYPIEPARNKHWHSAWATATTAGTSRLLDLVPQAR